MLMGPQVKTRVVDLIDTVVTFTDLMLVNLITASKVMLKPNRT